MSRVGCLELARRLGLDADDVVEWWLERSSVREFDGGLARDAAEADALDDTRVHFEAVAAQHHRGDAVTDETDDEADDGIDSLDSTDSTDSIDSIDDLDGLDGTDALDSIGIDSIDIDGIGIDSMDGIGGSDRIADQRLAAADERRAGVDERRAGVDERRAGADERRAGVDGIAGGVIAITEDENLGGTAAIVGADAELPPMITMTSDPSVDVGELNELRDSKRKGPKSAPTQLELPFVRKHEH